MLLEPLICGEWDGCSAWLQWNPLSPDTSYQLQIRFRKQESDPDAQWMGIIPQQGEKTHWAVIPVWREGWFADARVRVKGSGEEDWEPAAEVIFSRCTALFEFSSAKYDQHFEAGANFHCQVDAAACSYELLEPIEVKAGTSVRTRMQALGSSGYFQLDYPGHFDFKPTFGLRLWNVEPSENDVTKTGRMFTRLIPKPVNDVIAMAVGKPQRY